MKIMKPLNEYWDRIIFGFVVPILVAAFAIVLIGVIVHFVPEKTDAYIYIPDNGTRAAFHYTDIKMFDCAWCKRTKNLNRHHIVPQSANPLLKDEYTNIVVLCRDCHFVLGHRCNWKKFNPDVMEIINKYTNTVVSADYLIGNFYE